MVGLLDTRWVGRGDVLRHFLKALALAVALLAPSAGAASAADFTWTGAAAFAPPYWSSGANWSGSAPSGSVGTLSFPILTTGVCTAQMPTAPCYHSENDVIGLRASAMTIDDGGRYDISGNAITLGAGGLTVSTSSSAPRFQFLDIPIALGAPQTWSIHGGNVDDGGSIGGGVELGGDVTGPSADKLALTVGDSGFLILDHADVEVGAITIAGTDPAHTGAEAAMNGGVSIGIPGEDHALNGANGAPVHVTNAELDGHGTVGPLTMTGGLLRIGESTSVAAARLSVAGGATLDAESMATFFIDHAGTVAGTDYSQLSATGPVELGAARLRLLGFEAGGCPALVPGDVDTLVTTTGSLTGTFGNAPDGATVSIGCPNGTQAQPRARIDYTAHTVTATILAAASEPRNTSPPTISGTTTQGQTLTEANGSWDSPSELTYQWQECDGAGASCSAIPSATAQTYTLTAANVGHTLRVQETATNDDGSGSATSAATTIVRALPSPETAPANTSPPTVSGLPAVSGVLSCAPGSWSGSTPQSYAYQWTRDAAAIQGATGTSYLVIVDDASHALACQVTMTNSAGSTRATSASVSVAPGVGVAAARRARVKGTAADQQVSCAGASAATCSISIVLSVTETHKHGKVVAITADSKRETVIVGRARVSLSGGHHATVHVKLNTAGHRLLARRHNLRVTLTTTSKAMDGKNVLVRSQKVTFKAGKGSTNG